MPAGPDAVSQGVFDLPVGVQDLLGVPLPLLRQLPGQALVLHRQDLDGKQGGIDASIDGHGGYRDAGGHLDRGQKGVNAV